jgi:hypothetical protein
MSGAAELAAFALIYYRTLYTYTMALLTKLAKYDIKDSNIALLGSDVRSFLQVVLDDR